MYRQFQVLVGAYNTLLKTFLTPSYVILSPLLFCAATYTLILMGSRLDVVSLSIMSISLVVSLAMNLICFHFAVELFKKSRLLKGREAALGRRMRNSERSRVTKLSKIYWKSFPQMRIYFSDVNFFEDVTCFVILDFSVNQAVSLILVKA